jgi:hypothetical protein
MTVSDYNNYSAQNNQYTQHDQMEQERVVATLVSVLLALGIGTAIVAAIASNNQRKRQKNLGYRLEEALNQGRDNIQPVLQRIEKEVSHLRKQIEERVR